MVVHTSVKTPTAAAEWLIQRVAVQIDRVGELMSRLQRAVQGFVNAEKHRLVYYQQRLVGTVYQVVVKERGKLVLLDKTVDLHSPERIYKMGFSLTVANGKVLRHQADVQAGDVLQTHLQDGVVTSVVE